MPISYRALIADPTSSEKEAGKERVPESQGWGHCLDSVQAWLADPLVQVLSILAHE